MSVRQVLMHIPESINRGLNEGSLIRDAAGIVRIGPGQPNAGAIVAHLREVGWSSETASATSQMLMSAGLLAAIQLASTMYLKRRLDRLELLTQKALAATREVLATVNELRDHQYFEQARQVWRGYEFVRLWEREAKIADLEKAYESFVKGKADLTAMLDGHRNGEKLLENRRRVEFLLKSSAACAGGQIATIAQLEYSAQTQRSEVEDYCRVWGDVGRKVDSLKSPRDCLPTERMLDACRPDGPSAIAQIWEHDLRLAAEALLAEQELLYGLSETPQDTLEEFAREAESRKRGVYCLLSR